jgi:hypothetical protein
MSIPQEHMEVLNRTELVLKQFSDFMTGENSTLIIRNEAEYVNAAQVIAAVKSHKKDIEAAKESVVTPLYTEYKETLAQFKSPLDKVEEKIAALENAGREFRQRVEADARKQQAIADAKAAEERRKAEEKAEAERKKAEAYREQGRDDLANKADLRADNAEMKSQSVVAPIIQAPIAPSFRGSFNTRKNWQAKINRVDLLLEHFKSACPPEVEKAALIWANAQARAAKGSKSTIPGIEFYEI